MPQRMAVEVTGSTTPTWDATVTTMSARMIAHEAWTRIERPAMRPSGNVLIRAPGRSPPRRPPRSAPVRRSRRDAMNATITHSARITIPTTMAVSCQNSNGKSWTRRSFEGSNV